MFQLPDHHNNLSLRLSEVLDDLGVNEICLTKTRRMGLLTEGLLTVHEQSDGKPESIYTFGSQTEGTTTLGLNSDIDILMTLHITEVLQDWPEWQPDKLQFMMIQSDTTFPGYCLLQFVRPDVPLLVNANDLLNESFIVNDTDRVLPNEVFFVDDTDRVLLNNTSLYRAVIDTDHIRHGPAITIPGQSKDSDKDCVYSIYCRSWPKEAVPWLQQQSAHGWPTPEIKICSAEKGCFIVPVASKSGVHPDTEWRISTSHAERCLMFSLNITQIRCFILMKMITKSYIDPVCKDIISSYICKTLLFHCIADSEAQIWRENNIITCLTKCLESLLDSILSENCPHFIIPRNNLLTGKFTSDIKHKLGELLCKIMGNIEESLMAISIDEIGNRLHLKSGRLPRHQLRPDDDMADFRIFNACINVVYDLHKSLESEQMSLSKDSCVAAFQSVSKRLRNVSALYAFGNSNERKACCMYSPFLCTQLGSITASADIQHSRSVSPEARWWFSLGLNSDVSSSKLKLASALFCAGELERCEGILRLIEAQLGLPETTSVCNCNSSRQIRIGDEFLRACSEKNEEIVSETIAFCVRYLPCEAHCTPVELTYEMFRSTPNDQMYKSEDDLWTDWALVDSKPYLHFLQYKVFSWLQRPADQQTALNNLIRTINSEDDLGHKDTALNLLGQCFEQENKKQYALNCYVMSLNVRPRNNAAKWHVCRLLVKHLAEVINKSQ